MRILMVVLALALSAGLAHARQMVIRYDEGGYIWIYSKRVQEMNRRGDSIKIDGECWSACTMYLGVRNVCITKRAVLNFHGMLRNGATDAQTRQATAMLWAAWPAWVDRWVRANNTLASVKYYVTMQNSYALQFIPLCK